MTTEAERNTKVLIVIGALALILGAIFVVGFVMSLQAFINAPAATPVAQPQKVFVSPVTVGRINVEDSGNGIPVLYSWVENSKPYSFTVAVKVVVNGVDYYEEFEAQPGTTPFEILMYKGPSMKALGTKMTTSSEVKLIG